MLTCLYLLHYVATNSADQVIKVTAGECSILWQPKTHVVDTLRVLTHGLEKNTRKMHRKSHLKLEKQRTNKSIWPR